MKLLAAVLVAATLGMGIVVATENSFKVAPAVQPAQHIDPSPQDRPMVSKYRLTNCTKLGTDLLVEALRDARISVTMVSQTDGSSTIGVAKADWPTAQTLLVRLSRQNPNDFSEQEKSPVHLMSYEDYGLNRVTRKPLR